MSAPTSTIADQPPSSSAVAPVPSDPAAAAAWQALTSPTGEYAAAALYQAVIAKFGQVQPYVSIEAAEQRHIAALSLQLQRFGVAVPANPYLGKLAAPADLRSAAQAGVTDELRNVAMYDQLLVAARGDAALTRVLTNLRRASMEMHLPAFQAAVENGGQLTPSQMARIGIS
ncbi:MAG TPA: hypothetical protein VHO01_10440 [Jatrophihabitans sp.]|nr:hypothetical protein [Jatrophihabitans sp.]